MTTTPLTLLSECDLIVDVFGVTPSLTILVILLVSVMTTVRKINDWAKLMMLWPVLLLQCIVIHNCAYTAYGLDKA